MREFSVPQPERGVYWAMAKKAGRPMVFAVDSKGNEVRRLVLQDDSWKRGEAAVEFLWRYLDMVDPRPQICIVRPAQLPSTAAPARQEVATYDPYADPTPCGAPRAVPWIVR